jgi:hypothetical protein
MPTEVEVTIWECSQCRITYSSRDRALNCEERHKDITFMQRWVRVFPARHRDDSNVIRHCVACSKILELYSTEDYYQQNATGECIWKADCGTIEVMGGTYCIPCGLELRLRLLELMECYNHEKQRQEEAEKEAQGET